jgi:flagellin
MKGYIMRINTNVASLQAQTNSAQTNKNITTSLEKLSSGLRINKAADDASGMAIADKLRTQASALGQGISNANSGNALIQIADKAMSEQSNILDTVKTKLIQAATSTTSDNGREAIRKDIQKLLTQVDNISEQTTYNGINLLDEKGTEFSFQVGENSSFDIGLTTAYSVNTSGLGSAGNMETTQGTVKLTADALDLEGEVNDITVAVKSTTDGVSITGAAVATSGLAADSTFEVTANKVSGFTVISSVGGGVMLSTDDKEARAILDKQANKSTADSLTKISDGVYSLKSTADSTASAFKFDNGATIDVSDLKVSGLTSGTAAPTTGGTGDQLGILTSEEVSIHKTSGIRDVEVSGVLTTGLASNNFDVKVNSDTAGGLDFGNNLPEIQNGTIAVKSDNPTTDKYIAMNTTAGTKQEELSMTVSSDNVKSLSLVMTGGTASVTLRSTDANTVSALDDLVGSELSKNMDGSYTWASTSATDGVELDFGSEGIDISGLIIEDVQRGTAAGLSEQIAIETSETVSITNNNTSIEDDTGDFAVQTATAVALKTGGITTSTALSADSVSAGQAYENLSGLLSLDEGELTADVANNFMSVIDDALTQLNSVRADFGSTQNQLDAAIRNMMVTRVNIQNAESVIRDVDYAAESANFNKQNIIAQAGTYAMSQANNVQQNVMKLLQ